MSPIEDNTRALSTPNAPVEQREAIARIINPQAFDETYWMRGRMREQKDAFERADAILAVRLDEAAIRKDEREECAKIADPWPGFEISDTSSDTERAVVKIRAVIASAIRNGGKQPWASTTRDTSKMRLVLSGHSRAKRNRRCFANLVLSHRF